MTNKANNVAAIVDHIQKLAADGNNVKRIRGWLMFEHGIEGKDATKYIEKAGISGSVSSGFAAGFYAELTEKPMSDKRFEEIITGGSSNVQKHKSHYNAIREMANAIHASK